jgi:hypothetical protein
MDVGGNWNGSTYGVSTYAPANPTGRGLFVSAGCTGWANDQWNGFESVYEGFMAQTRVNQGWNPRVYYVPRVTGSRILTDILDIITTTKAYLVTTVVL